MSNSNHNLTITLNHPELQITLYDGFGEVVAMMADDPKLERTQNRSIQVIDSYSNSVTLTLPKGIYQVEGKLGGQTQSMAVRLNKDISTLAPQPEVYSAVPLSNTITSHHYYEQAAAALSQETSSKETSTDHTNQPNLVFMIRTINQAQAQPIRAYFRISGEDNNVVFDSRIHATIQNESQGWLGFSLALRQGGYIVELIEQQIGEQPAQQRAIPIWLTDRFQTQIFSLYTKGQIAYDSLRLLMADRSLGFDPQDQTLASTEIMTTSLIAGTQGLSGQSMRIALSGKFANPIVGLFAAHTLLRRKTLNQDLLRVVIENLERLLGDSPDVKALKVMFKLKLTEDIGEMTFDFPPTLRASYLGIVDADSQNPSVVEENSLFEKIGVGICTDSPFVTWDLSQTDKPEEALEWVKQNIVSSIATFASVPNTTPLATAELSKTMGITQNLLQNAALSILKGAGQQPAAGESALDFMNHQLPAFDDNHRATLKNLETQLSADETYQWITNKISTEK
ncbi:hypothetical protein [Vibrio sp. MEBiC08052]|uniref:hypothetical protein n=1 Tax=Vibrio sp. MEBiC08052 TaxID=1761910 RepID=UPI000740722A|nr:hypothetical protein [Vibrio sp. MEBiC08052]KUI97425.1 hypothetical protein VRK_33960 [Vibrio sp. MEBiC08052]